VNENGRNGEVNLTLGSERVKPNNNVVRCFGSEKFEEQRRIIRYLSLRCHPTTFLVAYVIS